jgi:hypothetical protein
MIRLRFSALLVATTVFADLSHAGLITFDSAFSTLSSGQTRTEGDYVYGPATNDGLVLWSSANGGSIWLSASRMFVERTDGGDFSFESVQHHASGSSTAIWTGYNDGLLVGTDTFAGIIGDNFSITYLPTNLAGATIDRLELSWTGSGLPYTDNLSLGDATSVPEPSTFVLITIGGCACVLRRRRNEPA